MSLPSRAISWLSPSVPTSALTSLHLDHCQLSEQNLGRLLLATLCLKWLEYNAWINVEHVPPHPKRPWEYFDCAEFGRSLVHVQENLEDLEVSISFFSKRHRFIDDRSKFRGTAGRLDTLRGFRKLQRLSIPITLLSGWIPDFEIFEKLGDLPVRLADIRLMNYLVYLDLSDEMCKILLLQTTTRQATIVAAVFLLIPRPMTPTANDWKKPPGRP